MEQRHTTHRCHCHQLTHNGSSVPQLSLPQRLCVCVCARVCVWWLLCFSRMLSPWQPNYYFQQYTDIQIENCNLECGSFLTGWWFIRCLYRRFFPLFFPPVFCFAFSVLCIIMYIGSVTEKESSDKKKTMLPLADFEWTVFTLHAMWLMEWSVFTHATVFYL